MTNLGRLAIIPARGGSRRLPRKNILDFGGSPMIAWTIEAAYRSGLFDTVVVSTEDDEIAAIAASYEATVLKRPAELAVDEVSVAEVAKHVLSTFSVTSDNFCLLMANCPLRTDADIHGAFRRLMQSGAEGVMSVVRYGWLRPDWALSEVSGWLRPVEENSSISVLPSSAPPVCPSGAIRWARTEAFLKNPTFYPERLLGFEMPWYRAIDIDEQEDFEIAACVAHALDSGFCFKTGFSES